MGWTHSWFREPELDDAAFAAAMTDCKSALMKADTDIAGFDGTGQPIFEPDHIVFNGRSPQSCEPFEVARVEFDRRGRSEVFSFCKTEGLPYDLAVQIALVILKHHLGSSLRVASDGTIDDWHGAIRFVQDELGYGNDFKLTESGG